ncbi:Geraniol 8-hydroxylase [Camellia lanceoleosa]|uniref:Geraniol 8-hydroxylase n=1 Tax=Camellia lanceoleosa TaxID=1840588 RepID=A0ACC0IYK1_9ERIC|nr:Geraniol 8-hydroxylase [Camellia lanceoleosa]
MDFLSFGLYLLLSLTSIRALFSFLRGTKQSQKLPRGPVPLPVIRNLLKLGNKPHLSLTELAKTQGPIMSLKFGRVTTVVISSSAMAKEVLQKQDLAFSNAAHAD